MTVWKCAIKGTKHVNWSHQTIFDVTTQTADSSSLSNFFLIKKAFACQVYLTNINLPKEGFIIMSMKEPFFAPKEPVN